MDKWKKRDSKLQRKRQLKQQRTFYGDSNSEKSRKNKDYIKERRQEKEDGYDLFIDNEGG